MGSLNLKWASGCLALWKVDSSKATLRGSYGNDQFERKEKGGARCKGGRRSVIVATGPAIDHAPAISQEPLTKDHLIHYMASGCKPKQNWRIGTEHEKFGFERKTLRSIDYEQLSALLNGIAERFDWEKIMGGYNIIGLKNIDDSNHHLNMVNRRRFIRVAVSDDEDEASRPRRTRKRLRLFEEEEDDDNDNKNEEQQLQKKEEVPESLQPAEDATPIGKPIRFSGKGKGKRSHYESFMFNGIEYTLEDSVLFFPEGKGQKPYAAIIKDIKQGSNGNVIVTGQWFYRPEEAEKKGGGNWELHDTRELFYSFHRDDVPAEAIMHKCVVHFIHKQLPKRKDHPGFIVQKVYDSVGKKLWRLGDKVYEDTKQREIDVLIHKTLERIGELPRIEFVENTDDAHDQMKSKKV